MKTIKLYTKSFCPFCQRALRLLDELSLPYENVVVDDQPDQWESLKVQYQWRTVPLILFDGELIGGSDELFDLHGKGTLIEILKK